MFRTLGTAFLAASCLFLATSAASAIEIRQQSGVQPLRPEGRLINGGVAGSTRSDPAARKCYGSTLCRESGTYYSEQGVLHYRNSDPIEQRQRSPGVRARGATPSINHIQWCQNRYNSYRTSDNSYQPFAGSRRACSSPFGS
ncbi:hypothetical protein ATN84_12745 [Paramesorhizobium deserti]|uniref:Lectin-like protein BA14k n=1 Tax=Paramesorhizobium deserti TaxID=1494590 RepID=A0A135HVB0_9HYPH|nr:BA14K family protein [Paramesorhizobium deserti]KXF77098.1 hypothetical protein ATN84_12745 [Paramesorhizobium deserti]